MFSLGWLLVTGLWLPIASSLYCTDSTPWYAGDWAEVAGALRQPVGYMLVTVLLAATVLRVGELLELAKHGDPVVAGGFARRSSPRSRPRLSACGACAPARARVRSAANQRRT